MSIDVSQAAFQLSEVIVSICRRCPTSALSLSLSPGACTPAWGCPGSQGPPGLSPHPHPALSRGPSRRPPEGFLLDGVISRELALPGRNTTASASSLAWGHPGAWMTSGSGQAGWGRGRRAAAPERRARGCCQLTPVFSRGSGVVFSVCGEII